MANMMESGKTSSRSSSLSNQTKPNEHVDDREHWLIRAKLQAPRQQIALIDRPRLMSSLEFALNRRLCLVTAPAGFGKTTLLAQWRQRLIANGAKVAWLTLDEGDAEARHFLAYVIFSLSEAGVDVGRLPLHAEQGLLELPLPSAIAQILEAVASADTSVALMLDDYHRLNSSDIDFILQRMLDTAPSNFTIVINSRASPSLMVPQLLAAGQGIEIGAEALRFSREETRAALDHNITENDLELLFERTEGWAIAIQLARLVGTTTNDANTTTDSLRGHSGHLATYLTDQIIAKLSPDIQDFLMRTSLCERFNAPLANALCQRQDSWEILRQLQALHALLVPLDDQQDWFRYHHLFADYLHDMLRRKRPELINTIHSTASQWFADNGYVSEAVRHARLAGDYNRCADLIQAAGGWELILFGGIGYLNTLLRNIPDRELSRFPRLLVAKAYLAVKHGQLVEARTLLESARQHADTPNALNDSRQGLGRDFLNVSILIDVYEDRWVSTESLQEIDLILQKISESDGVTRAILYCLETINNLAVGQFGQAQTANSSAFRAMRQGNTVLGLNYCYLHAGVTAFYQGKFRLAEANFWEAQRLAEDNFGADSGLKALSELLLNSLMFWSGSWQDDNAEKFRNAFDYAELYDGWFEVFAIGVDVEFASNRLYGNHRKSTAAIIRAETIAEKRGIRRLSRVADAHRLQQLADSGQDRAIAIELANTLNAACPLGVWRSQPEVWRPYQIIAPALASWYGRDDRQRALKILDDLVDCCRTFKASFYLLQALILRAQILDQMNERAKALASIIEAVSLAAEDRIMTPFRMHDGIQPLLYAAQKKLREDNADMVTLRFLSSCLEVLQFGNNKPKSDASTLFSPREYEVLLELMQGHSNKEIARTLDLTEHTVKFHLKNIFTKLHVDRRADAVSTARKLQLFP